MANSSTNSKEWALLNTLGYKFYNKASSYLVGNVVRLFICGYPVSFEWGEFRHYNPVKSIMLTDEEFGDLQVYPAIRCTDRDSLMSASVIMGDNIFGDFYYCKELYEVKFRIDKSTVLEVQQKDRYIYLPQKEGDRTIIIPDGTGAFQCKAFYANKVTQLITDK